VRRHLLSELSPAPVAKVLRDSGRPKRVIADPGLDPCRKRAPANHPVDIGLGQGIDGRLRGPAKRPMRNK
jgi:hypothetical protein